MKIWGRRWRGELERESTTKAEAKSRGGRSMERGTNKWLASRSPSRGIFGDNHFFKMHSVRDIIWVIVRSSSAAKLHSIRLAFFGVESFNCFLCYANWMRSLPHSLVRAVVQCLEQQQQRANQLPLRKFSRNAQNTLNLMRSKEYLFRSKLAEKTTSYRVTHSSVRGDDKENI